MRGENECAFDEVKWGFFVKGEEKKMHIWLFKWGESGDSAHLWYK